MEDKQHGFVLILAGYSRDESLSFIESRITIRFPFIIEFADYSVNQLLEIGKRMYEEREYQLSKEAEWKFRDHLHAVKVLIANYIL